MHQRSSDLHAVSSRSTNSKNVSSRSLIAVWVSLQVPTGLTRAPRQRGMLVWHSSPHHAAPSPFWHSSPSLPLSYSLSGSSPALPRHPFTPQCVTPSSSTSLIVHCQRSTKDAVVASLIFGTWTDRASSFDARRPTPPSHRSHRPWVEVEQGRDGRARSMAAMTRAQSAGEPWG
jgi:hypothetical protein